MRDVTVTKATGPFAHQTLTHAPPQTRVGRAHRTPDTPPAALHPTTRACTKPVLTQVWITRHSLALKPHVSWKQHEFRWKWLLKSALTRHTARNQPANKQQNKKKAAAQAVRRRCAEAAGASNDRLTCGWMICDSGLLTGWAISEQTHQQTLNYVLPKRSRDWSAAGNPNLTCCR